MAKMFANAFVEEDKHDDEPEGGYLRRGEPSISGGMGRFMIWRMVGMTSARRPSERRLVEGWVGLPEASFL